MYQTQRICDRLRDYDGVSDFVLKPGKRSADEIFESVDGSPTVIYHFYSNKCIRVVRDSGRLFGGGPLAFSERLDRLRLRETTMKANVINSKVSFTDYETKSNTYAPSCNLITEREFAGSIQ